MNPLSKPYTSPFREEILLLAREHQQASCEADAANELTIKSSYIPKFSMCSAKNIVPFSSQESTCRLLLLSKISKSCSLNLSANTL